ncbi:MAG: hypothetical protein RLZZ366_590, partial [Pseudomonadota bacterium]
VLNTGALTLAATNAFSNLTINSLGLLAQSMQAGQSVQIVADGPISFTTLNAGADASVSANGAIDGTSVTTAGPLSVDGSLGISVPTIHSGSAVTLDAFNGNILVATDLAALGPVRAFGLDVNLTALGALTLTSADARTGNLLVQSGGALTVLDASAAIGDVTLMGADIIVSRDVTAGRNLVATTPGALTIDSLATLIGTTITLNSSDIVIDTSSEPGQIGRFSVTHSVTLNNNGNRQTYIGGNGGTGTYGLSNAEAQLIFGDNITITAPRLTQSTAGQSSAALNTRAPDVILDTLTLSAAGATSGNFGANGIYRINTPGKLRTIGAVTFNNLGTGNRFEINAAEAIEIDAATGVISLRNPTNGLGGTLVLTSQDVIAATLPAITDVIGAATLKAVSDRLAKNDGAVLDQGYLRADSIVVTISNGFYVQNSGAATLNPRDFDPRRGLTVGAGGLSINTGTNSAARIAINGQQMGASATATTGIDFLKLVSINGGSVGKGSLGTGLFDFASTINGCQILSIASCQVSFDNGNIARDVIGDIEAGGYSNPLSVSLIEIKDVEKNVNEPIIDDPVTGAGNDDLWAVDDEKDCDPAAAVCEKP